MPTNAKIKSNPENSPTVRVMEKKVPETKKSHTPKLGLCPGLGAFYRLIFGVSHFNPSEEDGNGNVDVDGW